MLPEAVYPDLSQVRFHTDLPWFVDAIVRWDSLHYLSIAQHGYSVGENQWDTNTPFFPLYPWLMRLLGGWTGEQGLILAGLLLSNLAFFAAMVLLYKLVAEITEPIIAQRSILYLALFPTSFFFSSLYAESLFLFVVVAFFYMLRCKNWWVAGLFGGLATLTRGPGVLLALVFTWEYMRSLKWSVRQVRWPLFAVMLVPTALAVLFIVQWRQAGDPLAVSNALGMWRTTADGPLEGLRLVFWGLASRTNLPGFGLIFPASMTLLFIAAGIRTKSQPSSWQVWFWSYFITVVVLSNAVTTPFYSAIRFYLAVFPAFVVFAQWGAAPVFHRTYLTVSSFFLLLSTILFSRWYWVA